MPNILLYALFYYTQRFKDYNSVILLCLFAKQLFFVVNCSKFHCIVLELFKYFESKRCAEKNTEGHV